MPRSCTVCGHDARSEIDRALVGGQPYRAIAQRFAASPDAVLRHKREHLPVQLVRAHDAAEVADADNLLDQVKRLQARAMSILDTAEAAGELRTALHAIREARECVSLLGELAGQLDKRPQINILASADWPVVTRVMLEALGPWPEQRVAVASALLALDHAGN